MDSDIEYPIQEVHLLESGNYYFFEKFIVSEIHEGVHFNWKKAKEVIDLAYQYYGPEPKLVYVSNRVNSYSIVPQDWVKFFKEKHPLKAMAVVCNKKAGMSNLVFEKLFFTSIIKRFTTLKEATIWANDL